MGEIIQIIFYGGALQGFLLSVFLFSIRTNKISNRLLGLLTMLWGVVLLVFALQGKGLYQRFPHLLLVFDQLIFLFFPLLYLHVKYLLTSHNKFHSRDLLHFLPFFLGIIFNMNFFVMSAQEKFELLDNPSHYFEVMHIVSNEIISLQGIIYSLLAIILIRKYRARILDYASSVQKNLIKVLYAGISLNLLSWMMGIVDVHLGYFNIDLGIDLFAITYLILAVVIFVISYAALKSPEVFKLDIDAGLSEDVSMRKMIKGPPDASQGQSASISEEETLSPANEPANYKNADQKLIDYIEHEKPYLNPDLSLPALAQAVDMSRNQLSIVINQVHKKNFYEFINDYRVNEVKRLMDDPANKHLKLMSLAYDAGFNSKATFNRIFKQMTGMTPSEYNARQA